MDAPTGPAYIYRATCARIVDGDTFVATIDLGFGVSTTVSIRLHGCNAPEHNTAAGPPATAYLTGLLVPGGTPAPLLLVSYKDVRSFARWVADVFVGGQSVSAAMIAAGQAVPFMV